MKKLINLLVLIIVIAVGVMAAMMMVKNKKQVEHKSTEMAALPVETLVLQKQTFTPQVVAYGNVEPAVTLQSKAQVSGKISYIHPQLKQGGSLAAGTEVIRIDPADYRTSLDQTRADLSANQAQLEQLDQEERNVKDALVLARRNLKAAEKNLDNVRRKDLPVQRNTGLIQRNLELARKNYTITERNLGFAKRNLTLAKRELARVQELGRERLIAFSQVEAQEQQVLQQEQQVLQLEQSLVQNQQSIVQQEQQLTQQDQSLAQQDQNVLQQQQQIIQQQQSVTDLLGQLKTFNSRRASTLAQIRRAEQQVKSQKTTLSRTRITLPFDARISMVEVDKGSFIAVGGTLFEAINTDGIEIKAELPLQQINQLLSPLSGQSLDLTARQAQKALESLNLTASVNVVGKYDGGTWDARVARFSETIDPVKRTMGIVVAVDKPYDNVVVGDRLPLIKGMYVKAKIKAPSIRTLIVPRKAVHQGRVYIMNEQSRLEIRPLNIRLVAGEQVIVKDGIKAGERIITNDLIPVIPNMPLKMTEAQR